LATVYRSLTSGSGYSPIGTSPTDTNVTAGTRYYYVVRADNGAALGSYSNEVSAIPLASGTPAAPINVAAEPVNGEVQVSWAPVAGANGYVVSAALSIGGAPYATCSTAEPFETRCSVGLPNETTFHFSVRASNGVTLSADSAEVIATPTGQGTTAGLPATSVSVVGGNGALTVRWSPVVGATLYRVFRRSRLTDWAQLGAATPATAVNDVSTVNGTEYVYAVQATNTSGLRVSPWARTVYVTATARRPVRPQNFAVVPYDHGLMARWSPIAGATGYVVQAGFYPGWSASTPQVSCSTDDPYETRCSLAADNGTPYFVSMYATTPEGSSAFTDELSRTPDPTAPAPPMPTVLAGNGSISLRAPPISGATSYRFFRRTFGTDWTQVGNPTIPLFQQVLSNAIGYRYAVQTVNASGVGSEWQFTGWTSAQADRPPVPTGVTLTPGNGVVQLRWEPVDGVVAYYFYNATGPGQPLGLRDSTADALDTQWSWAQSNGVATTLTLLGLMPSVYGDTSAEVTATPSTASPLSPTLTFVPGNEAMQLLWAPVSGATGYRVYRRSPASEWQLHVTLTVPGLIGADVQNGESFQYAVQSVGAGGVSAWARTAVALVNAALPHAPTDVALQPGNAALQVEWAAVTGATGYYLYTAPTQSGPWTYVGSPGGSETRFAAPATNGTPTWVAVTATSATGTGVSSVPTSATASASRPTAVSLAAAALVTPGSVALTWSVAADAVSYRVYRRPANGALSFVTSTSSLNYDDVGLASGTTYVWYVETENAAGRGAWSNAASVAAP
jgi:fibronectin type 3 domain-containing protein